MERNPHYIGIFYVGVKLTSISSIVTCRAIKPNFEVDFTQHSKMLLMQDINHLVVLDIHIKRS